MGFMRFFENETVNLAEFGFKVGDAVKVTCVGGGGSTSNSNTDYPLYSSTGYGGAAYRQKNSYYYSGIGERGKVETKKIVLNNLQIPITIGAGGYPTVGASGTSTSFGTYLTALGGIAQDRNGNPARESLNYIGVSGTNNFAKIPEYGCQVEAKDGLGIVVLQW